MCAQQEPQSLTAAKQLTAFQSKPMIFSLKERLSRQLNNNNQLINLKIRGQKLKRMVLEIRTRSKLVTTPFPKLGLTSTASSNQSSAHSKDSSPQQQTRVNL
jgi:hypothetical protein